MGKLSINGPFSMAILSNQRVSSGTIPVGHPGTCCSVAMKIMGHPQNPFEGITMFSVQKGTIEDTNGNT